MIREFNHKDIASINEIGLLIKNTFDITKTYNNNVEKLYIYEQNNEILGFIQISDSFGDIDIIDIAVREAYQNKGIGKELINYIVDNLKPNKIMLEVRNDNIKAIEFYKKIGFKEINRRTNYYGDADALIMEMK